MSKTIIITDLDGTLLDPVTYSFEPALPALGLIETLNIPLILCSSKTRAEIEAVRKRLNNCYPFISENGGGIFFPPSYFPVLSGVEESESLHLISLGMPYEDIRRHFIQIREQLQLKVRGFGDMTAEEVAKLTDLSYEEAMLAKQRDFDEPFVFDGAPDERFLRAIEAFGLHWTQGRIFHLTGDHDKGRAVSILLEMYKEKYDGVTSIGLGDSLNDLSMLKSVDTPVLVRREDGSFDTRIAIPKLLTTQLPGPSGWNSAILRLLNPKVMADTYDIDLRKTLSAIFDAALGAVDPYNAVINAVSVEGDELHVDGKTYDLASFRRIIVVGAGKATARMALAVEFLLADRIDSGLIVVKDGHTAPLKTVEQVEASHPVPNDAGVAGTQRILDLVRSADRETLVICLLSGGASALLVAPVEGVTLSDKQETTRLLLNAGASIYELNTVRKHLSLVKGGRLAQIVFPAQMLTLIVSDVIGDRLDVIASGPTSPDPSTFTEARAIVAKFGLQQRLPERVSDYILQGISGQIPETVKPNDLRLTDTRNVIVANIRQALGAAAERASQLGFETRTISDTLQGEARDAAHFLAMAAHTELERMKAGERHCLLSGGETTVTVHGNGKGGRNQEMALAFALEIENWTVQNTGVGRVAMLSAGTDGTDGPTDAAGAMVDWETIRQAKNMEIDPLNYLVLNDSYEFFRQFDAVSGAHSHLKTGPTGTNVMDIQIVLLAIKQLTDKGASELES
jgi:hydroxypyruvate reductase